MPDASIPYDDNAAIFAVYFRRAPAGANNAGTRRPAAPLLVVCTTDRGHIGGGGGTYTSLSSAALLFVAAATTAAAPTRLYCGAVLASVPPLQRGRWHSTCCCAPPIQSPHEPGDRPVTPFERLGHEQPQRRRVCRSEGRTLRRRGERIRVSESGRSCTTPHGSENPQRIV